MQDLLFQTKTPNTARLLADFLAIAGAIQQANAGLGQLSAKVERMGRQTVSLSKTLAQAAQLPARAAAAQDATNSQAQPAAANHPNPQPPASFDAKKQQQQVEDLLNSAQKLGDVLNNAFQSATMERIRELNEALKTQADRVEKIRGAMAKGGEAAQEYSATQLQAEEERLSRLEQLCNAELQKQRAAAILQMTLNAAIAVSKAAAQGGVTAPITIAVTLAALAVGLALARSQAGAAAQAESGGVTGLGRLVNVRNGGLLRGARHSAGGILIEAEDGERIFDRKTSRRFQPVFQAIAAGKLRPEDLSTTLNVHASNRELGQKLDVLGQKMDVFIQVARNLPQTSLHIDERGLHASVARIEAGRQRLLNRIQRKG